MSKEIINDLSYYEMYLRKYLIDTNSPLKDDEEFIKERTDSAEVEYEERRRDGYTVSQAQECAIAVLVNGLSDEQT